MGRKIDSGVSFDAFVANKVENYCPEFNEEVAIKLAKHQHDPQLYHEIATLDKMNHPNIIRLLDFNIEESQQFIVLELAERDLFEEISIGEVDQSNIKRDIHGLVSALIYLNLEGMSHLDIKPSNILRGKDGLLKLADFGHADSSDDQLEYRGTKNY